MEKIFIVILLVIIAIALYLLARNQNIESSKENFTVVVGTSNPMVTYDDYGTFNFILHTDDLPYHDPTYDILSDYTKNRLDKKTKNRRPGWTEDFDTDSFFELCGYKIRRELIPSNYAENDGVHFHKFVIHSNIPEHGKFNKFVNSNIAREVNVPTSKRLAPEPYNYYFKN